MLRKRPMSAAGCFVNKKGKHMTIEGFDDALAVVREAQRKIDEQVALIGDVLDAVLQKDGSFGGMDDEQLESCIKALPDGCFYAVYLKREWRRRSEPLMARPK